MDHLLFMFHICHAFLPVHCSLVVTCWERADHLALLYVMFYCVHVTFPCGVLGQVWYMVVSIPYLYPFSLLLCVSTNLGQIGKILPETVSLAYMS